MPRNTQVNRFKMADCGVDLDWDASGEHFVNVDSQNNLNIF